MRQKEFVKSHSGNVYCGSFHFFGQCKLFAEIAQKENAIGVILGNGRFYTMRQNYKPYKIPTFGYPKLRMNLIVEYTDAADRQSPRTFPGN